MFKELRESIPDKYHVIVKNMLSKFNAVIGLKNQPKDIKKEIVKLITPTFKKENITHQDIINCFILFYSRWDIDIKPAFIRTKYDKFKFILEEEKEIKELQKNIWLLLANKERSNATEMIVKYIMSNKNIYSLRQDKETEMWIYKDGVYVSQGKSYIKEVARKILGKAHTTHIVNEVINKIEADTFIEFDDFFNNISIYEIPLQNGILNIRTRELQKFNPKNIFFNKMPIKYIPKQTCPKILNFISDIVETPEDILIVQELLGYYLLKDHRFKAAFMFDGAGDNGKTQLINLMEKFLGKLNTCNVSLEELEKNQWSVFDYFGKLANFSADLSPTALRKTGIFKNLSGGDPVRGHRRFLTTIEFTSYAVNVFACNQIPKIYDLSDGFFSRWVLVKFPYKFLTERKYEALNEKERSKIKAKKAIENIYEQISSDEEMTGLLNFALDGLDRLIKQKGFTLNEATKDLRNYWTRKANSFLAFTQDMVEESWGEFISKAELLQNYVTYCKQHKVMVEQEKEIKRILIEEFGVYEERKRFGDDRILVWKNIKFINKTTSGQGGQGGQYDSTLSQTSNFIVRSNTPDQSGTPDHHLINNCQVLKTKFDKLINYVDLFDGKFNNYNEIVKEFGEDVLRDAMKQGYVFENPKGTIRKL